MSLFQQLPHCPVIFFVAIMSDISVLLFPLLWYDKTQTEC
jgi:hypothetical protein